MQVQKIQVNSKQFLWIVLDDNFLPIEPISNYLSYLLNTEKSPNTLRTYANHLKLYWEFLKINSTHWKTVTLDVLAQFIHWLRHEQTNIIALNSASTQRTTSTVNAILASISSLYRYFNQLGITDIHLTEATHWHVAPYKSLLHHIYKRKSQTKRIFKLKTTREFPKCLTPQQIEQLLNATSNARDYFLIHLLSETGLRIGQALRLKHENIKSWDNEIIIHPGNSSLHESQNKSKTINILHVSPLLMQSYARYTDTLNEETVSEFIFINLKNDQCLTYAAVSKLFLRLSKKLQFHMTPHMLRHSHATELLRNGWDPTLVQKRLGHKSIHTTLDIYSHVSTEDLKKAYKNYLIQRGDIL